MSLNQSDFLGLLTDTEQWMMMQGLSTQGVFPTIVTHWLSRPYMSSDDYDAVINILDAHNLLDDETRAATLLASSSRPDPSETIKEVLFQNDQASLAYINSNITLPTT